MPLGKFVTLSEPIRRKYVPSSSNTTTQCPFRNIENEFLIKNNFCHTLKSQTKYSLLKMAISDGSRI